MTLLRIAARSLFPPVLYPHTYPDSPPSVRRMILAHGFGMAGMLVSLPFTFLFSLIFLMGLYQVVDSLQVYLPWLGQFGYFFSHMFIMAGRGFFLFLVGAVTAVIQLVFLYRWVGWPLGWVASGGVGTFLFWYVMTHIWTRVGDWLAPGYDQLASGSVSPYLLTTVPAGFLAGLCMAAIQSAWLSGGRRFYGRAGAWLWALALPVMIAGSILFLGWHGL